MKPLVIQSACADGNDREGFGTARAQQDVLGSIDAGERRDDAGQHQRTQHDRQRDPIPQMTQYLIEKGLLTGDAAQKMQEEVKKQDWDPSVQAMVVFPDLVKNMTGDTKVTAGAKT